MASFPNFNDQQRSSSKMFVSLGELPNYIDPSQPPTKKSPWRQINQVPFVQQATLILPEELYELIWNKIQENLKASRYAKVIVKLVDILNGPFFNDYIKKGNILMLSEGHAGADNLFSLQNGTLTIDMDRESYERSSVQGHSVQSGGRRHVKSRYRVEIGLREPSMLHGKKGFERIMFAAKNVLNRPLVWLFQDLESEKSSSTSSPIEKHHPTWVDSVAQVTNRSEVLVPDAVTRSNTSPPGRPPVEDDEFMYEVVEWLDLLSMDSPRVRKNDRIDPYLSRYAPSEPQTTVSNVCVVQWHGFLSTDWITQLLIALIKESRTSHSTHWLALSVSGHRTDIVGQRDGYTILLQPGTGPNAHYDNDTMEVDLSPQLATESQATGLRRFMCFEFVDSVVQ